MSQRYLIALGSNQYRSGIGGPRAILRSALQALTAAGVELEARSPIIDSAPVGPSQRRYANAAALVRSDADPPALLVRLQEIERAFGRRRRGQRWQARPLDLDIVLWSGGVWHGPTLTIPHSRMHQRRFVLGPAAAIAPGWCDPNSGRTLTQLEARLTRPRPLPR